MKNRTLFPKTKINWLALPMLIYYGEKRIKHLFDPELLHEDDRALGMLLVKYCDSGETGDPLKSHHSERYLRLRDGRTVSLRELKDAMWDSAERQQETIKEFLRQRDEDVEALTGRNEP